MVTIFMTGCENNKGPFEIKLENGTPILYSGNKPVSSMVKYSVKDSEVKREYEVFEGEFKKGLLTGKVKYFTVNGIDSLEFDGKMESDGKFVGKIKTYANMEYSGEVNYEIDVKESKFDLVKLLNPDKTKKMKISDISEYLITATGKRSDNGSTFKWIDGKAYSDKFINISENLEKKIRAMKTSESYYGLLSSDNEKFISFQYNFPSREHVSEYDDIGDFAGEINVSSSSEKKGYYFS